MLMNKLRQILTFARKKPLIFILDSIVSILSVLLLIIIVSAVGELIDDYHYASNEERMFSYRMEEENYSEMVGMYYENVAAERGDNAALQEYYGVAKYFEAATNYKLYLDAGENQKAAVWKEKMDEAFKQMGDFAFVSENIQKKLGLVEETTIAKVSSGIVTFTDDLGREVTVENPKQVAALLGSYADIWYLAGGTVCASADDAWDDFELPLPEDAINLGMTKELSLEKLFEAEPDFVLASSNTSQHLEWKDTLESAGLAVAYFDVTDFDDYLRVLNICTQITGKTELYEQNGTSIQEKIDAVVEESQKKIAEAGMAPTVLSLRSSATYLRAKNSKDNVLGEMLKALGCINIADSDDTLLENLSIEHIIEADPDYILICPQGNDVEGIKAQVESSITGNPLWSELTAVKEGRVYLMDKSLYSLKPNDRWGEAYEQLFELLFKE